MVPEPGSTSDSAFDFEKSSSDFFQPLFVPNEIKVLLLPCSATSPGRGVYRGTDSAVCVESNALVLRAVSYTHLTLPTIRSV